MARDWMSSSRSRGPSVLGRPGIDGEVTQTIIILLKGSAGKPFKHTGSGPSRSAHFATGLGEQQQQQQQQQKREVAAAHKLMWPCQHLHRGCLVTWRRQQFREDAVQNMATS